MGAGQSTVSSQAVRQSTVCESHKIPCFITALPLLSCAIKVVVRTILSSSSSSITTTTTTSTTSQPSGDNWWRILASNVNPSNNQLRRVTRSQQALVSDTAPVPHMAENTHVPKLTCFTGSPHSEITATVWMSRFERYSDILNWNNDKKIKNFPLFLDGAAAGWYETLSEAERENFAQLKEQFVSRYETYTGLPWASVDQLVNRMQGECEPVETYIEDMRRKASHVNVSDEQLINFVIRGLRPNIRQFVTTKGCASLKELLQHARMAQSLYMTNSTVVHSVTHPCARENNIQSIVSDMMATQRESINAQLKEQRDILSRLCTQINEVHLAPPPQQRQERSARRVDFSSRERSHSGSRTNVNRYRRSCFRCKGTDHDSNNCRAREYVCYGCGKTGHIRRACMAGQRYNK